MATMSRLRRAYSDDMTPWDFNSEMDGLIMVALVFVTALGFTGMALLFSLMFWKLTRRRDKE